MKRIVVDELIGSSRRFQRCLDVGCGDQRYARFVPAEEYIAIDVEESWANRHPTRPDFWFDGRHIPFEDSSFDLILCTEVLEHAEDPGQLVREMSRVLQPGGMLFVTVPSMWGEHETPYDFRRFTSFGVRKLLEQGDFSILTALKEKAGIESWVSLGLSEISHSRRGFRWPSRYLVRLTGFLLRAIFRVEMPRIFLANVVWAERN